MNGIFALGFIIVAAITKRRAFSVEEKIEVTLVRRMTADTTVFKGRMNPGLAFGFAFMTHIAQPGVRRGQSEAVFISGMVFSRSFVADRTFLRGNRSVDITGFTDNGVAIRSDTSVGGQGTTCPENNEKNQQTSAHDNLPANRIR